MSTMRQKRVAEQIQKVISERLVRGLKDPVPGFLTIREVDVTRDFSRARVFFSIYGTDAQRAEAKVVLDQHRGALRREVGQKIKLRQTPEIVFVEDNSGERAARIHQLLNDAQRMSDPASSSDKEPRDESNGSGEEE